MGYYNPNGSGVIKSGSDTIKVTGSAVGHWQNVYDQLTFFSREITKVTSKAGVSLQAAQAEQSSSSITGGNCIWASYVVPFAVRNGTTKDVSYQQIGDSNLYELIITEKEFHSRVNNGNWA